ncbi:hypothetical protein ACD471_17525|uniref:hypothetical protein n=1 Tax=Clostridioides difficile TaxID=1496 RepID=UPI00355C6B20
MKSRQELIKDIEKYRKAQYLIYLDIVQRAWADRSLTTDEQDRIMKHMQSTKG